MPLPVEAAVTRSRLTDVMSLVLLAGAWPAPVPAASATRPADPLAAAVAAPGRPEADRSRDAHRRPAEVLRACGVTPGSRVGELMAGAGYYTEILAGAVGVEGRVYAHNSPFVLERFAEQPFSERLARMGAAHVTRLDAPPEDPGLPPGLDVVLLIRFYHDFYWQEVDRAAVNRAVWNALRPGGVYCVVDHHAEAGSRDRDTATLHRVDAEMVKEEILAAGFGWDGESDVLRVPEDDRTWFIFADDGARRDRTDRFLFRFVRPLSSPGR